MIAQWENECISLSVLSMARVIIAQWENERISLSVLSMARVMIAQWENACISLSVLSMARVMIAHCLSSPWSGFNSRTVAEYFKGFFPGWSHSANPSWASMTENSSISFNGATQPVDFEEEGQSLTTDRQWLKVSTTQFPFKTARVLSHHYQWYLCLIGIWSQGAAVRSL